MKAIEKRLASRTLIRDYSAAKRSKGDSLLLKSIVFLHYSGSTVSQVLLERDSYFVAMRCGCVLLCAGM